jgi:uncharacterized protein involved in exopolysaccharide biosynthesis
MPIPETRTMEPLSRSLLGPAVDDDSEPEPSLREIMRVLQQHWRRIVVLGLVASILTAIVAFTSPRTFTSTASFYPESRGSSGGLNSLSQQFGINLGGSDPVQSIQFYVALVGSREILGRLVLDSLWTTSPKGRVMKPVGDLLDLPKQSQAERIEAGVDALRRIITPIPSVTTGIVRIDVTTRSPGLSQALAQRTIDLINEFNLQKRQSQGASERRFAEGRLTEMASSLRAAEAQLEDFEQRNAEYLRSPQLRIEHARLQNNLAAKQMLQTTLTQSYEQARMQEVRDTPVITVLERPAVPVRPNSRHALQKTLFAFIVGVMLGIVLAFVRPNFGFWKPSRL